MAEVSPAGVPVLDGRGTLRPNADERGRLDDVDLAARELKQASRARAMAS